MKDMIDPVRIKGLKCDNPECNYHDETIEFKNYKQYIGYPCPLCGQNLLTKKDYNFSLLFVRLFNNPLSKFILNILPVKKNYVRFDMHIKE
jgi:ssDNA-binding Zn-finger/Zn-ribbon topoisomerase 1